MTEQERMLEFLNNMTQVAKENRQKAMEEAALGLHDVYTAYLKAGFTSRQAMELTKQTLELGFRTQK